MAGSVGKRAAIFILGVVSWKYVDSLIVHYYLLKKNLVRTILANTAQKNHPNETHINHTGGREDSG